MTNVLINSDIRHVRAGQVGRMLEGDELKKHLNFTGDLPEGVIIVEFPDNITVIFGEDEYKLIDLKPIPPAFKEYLNKLNLLNWLEK